MHMTQFDPSMVAEMLMSPIRRASENLGGGPMGIGADAGGSYFVDPEVAGRTGYGTAVTGASFFPGAGIVDAYGGAVDISGQPLPSFSENIGQGNYLDAALQGLGVAGDVATVAAPATLGASAVLGTLLKAPRAAQKVTKATDVASDVGSIAKVEPPTETKPGIIAFHGSGADFDEFRLDKIGTGEGAQAFGYGLYFSDSEDIGNFYKKQLTGSSFETKDGKIFDPYAVGDDGKRTIKNPNIRTSIAQSDGDIDKPIAKAEKIIANMPNTQASELAEKDLIILRDLKDKGGLTVNKGKTYKVALEPKPEELLDYDKPIGQQNEFVTERLKKVVEEITLDDAFNLGIDPFEINLEKGFTPPISDLQANLASKQAIEKAKQNMLDPDRTVISFLNDWAVFRGEQATGEKLLDKYGIKGIKYKANQGAGARNVPETGKDNYVIFDDKLINILEKYGIVGSVAVSATAAALRDDDGST